MEALELMDCTSITHEQMAEALDELIPAGLKVLVISYCGLRLG